MGFVLSSRLALGRGGSRALLGRPALILRLLQLVQGYSLCSPATSVVFSSDSVSESGGELETMHLASPIR